jgi:hypothetical protein
LTSWRFKSRGRGLCSIENKRNDTGLRFVLHTPEEGHLGYLVWNQDRLPSLLDWNDSVVTHGLAQRIKYACLIRRPASSSQAKGADATGCRYVVQLALEGSPHHKLKHAVGSDVMGLDVGHSTLAIVPRQAEARLEVLAWHLAPKEKQMRRLQRQMDRPDGQPIRSTMTSRDGPRSEARGVPPALEAEQGL